jgi:hypothetical protein
VKLAGDSSLRSESPALSRTVIMKLIKSKIIYNITVAIQQKERCRNNRLSRSILYYFIRILNSFSKIKEINTIR